MACMSLLLLWTLLIGAYSYKLAVPHGINARKVAYVAATVKLPSTQFKFEGHLNGRVDSSTDSFPVPSQLPMNFHSRLIGVNRLFYRSSWVAWWVQIILSVISCVILTFANAVRPMGLKANYMWISGFAFSSIGVLVALVNAFWTWNVTRLCRRIVTKNIDDSIAVSLHRRYAKTSVLISLVGMLFALLGAEQIVGTLGSKILSAGSFGYAAPGGVTLNGALAVTPIQAVDIFLVQANTNSLLSHFASLLCYLFLQTRLPKLRGGSPTINNISSSNTTAPQAADNAKDDSGSTAPTGNGAPSGGKR